jgi:hypothetical protein
VLPAGAAADVPVELGREAARRLAQLELARPEYAAGRPGLFSRAAGWLRDRLGDLLGPVAGAATNPWVGLLVLVALMAVLAVAVRLRTGPLARAGRREPALFGGTERTAAEHRAAADRCAGDGDWAGAVRERLRAVVRSLEERTLLDPRPGRTADEAAAEAGLVLPGSAADLRGAARRFDDVVYGGRPAGAEDDAALRALDERVAAERPQLAAGR